MEVIRELYLSDARPWVIGYSGGKDSTATVQAVWYAIKELPREQLKKSIYVIASDTLVETPVIVDHLTRTLDQINSAAQAAGLPFSAHKVVPDPDDTFWVNLIGRGYPAPYNKFRWCTDRMKIRPATKFIVDKVTKFGEVTLILGARKAESASRAQVMNARRKVGDRLSRHCDIPGAWVFTPLEDWQTEDVWMYLLSTPAPWGGRNRDLVTMYKNAQAGECPLVVDKSTPSCGSSRFGCWTCTVVTKDKSMEAMIDGGQDWMEPLLAFRNWLATTADPAVKPKIREHRRRSGRVEFLGEGAKRKIKWGPYTLTFRQEILRKLLQAQQAVRKDGPDRNAVLITEPELLRIRQLWQFAEGDWQDSLPRIYNEVVGSSLTYEADDWSGMGSLEAEVLATVAASHQIPDGLMRELFDAERDQHGMNRRSRIYERIDAILKKDWISRDEVFRSVGVVDTADEEEE
jgi:DNA sulfur modification protein DndC